jgi:hypothetical protein
MLEFEGWTCSKSGKGDRRNEERGGKKNLRKEEVKRQKTFYFG